MSLRFKECWKFNAHLGQTDGDSVIVWVSSSPDSLSGSACWVLIWRKLLLTSTNSAAPFLHSSPLFCIYPAIFLCFCAYSCSWWANGQHIDHACSTSKLGSTTKEAPSPPSGNNCRFQTVICACFSENNPEPTHPDLHPTCCNLVCLRASFNPHQGE